jgi:hypothetical protein
MKVWQVGIVVGGVFAAIGVFTLRAIQQARPF